MIIIVILNFTTSVGVVISDSLGRALELGIFCVTQFKSIPHHYAECSGHVWPNACHFKNI